MSATTTLNIRVDAEVKRKAELICQELGMNLSTAINIFLRQTVRSDGIPFDVRLDRPNAQTLAAMDDVENRRNLFGPFHDTRSLMEALTEDA
ncbi:MAG: type II toxin-antitoxin system RelB/DinJ family antitoxin [Clostridia bacterium]|nr:type II toxin-antitoxin system RelB/DinJ family antitoxin [Clostridia bacterium]